MEIAEKTKETLIPNTISTRTLNPKPYIQGLALSRKQPHEGANSLNPKF